MYPPVQLPLTGSNKIERGASWGSLEIFFPGNFILWNPLGQIRTKAGGKLLATFGFEPIILADRVENGEIIGVYSRIAPFLTFAQTIVEFFTNVRGIYEFFNFNSLAGYCFDCWINWISQCIPIRINNA
jgi:hypothetical protein